MRGRGWARVWLLAAALLVGTYEARGQVDDETCQECHADPALTDDAGRLLFVVTDSIAHSVHEGMACTDCHGDVEDVPHAETLAKVACAECHDDVQEIYEASVHGAALVGWDTDAPSCADCHGTHTIRSPDDEASWVYPKNLVATCARCHADPKVIERHPFSVRAPVEAYIRSAHYSALNGNGSERAANCSTCHGAHDILPARDPNSKIYWQHVPGTCGQCHVEISETYAGSVHGAAAAAGKREAPVCTDCHGEHEIRGPMDPASMVYSSRISKTTCVWCHASVRVTEKYGIPGGRVQSYQDSYHGLADKGGSAAVANCASCHGIHNIRKSTDPASTIHPDHLPETCGSCHPGVGVNVALGPIHVDPSVENGNGFGGRVTYYVRQFYIALIVGTILFMALHNALDLYHKRNSPRLPKGTDYLRFTGGERIQHATMAISFIVLAYSGFALEYPQAWWAAPFSNEIVRRYVHRAAAVAMVAVCLYHVVYVIVTRRGRAQIAAMAPGVQDVRDFVQMARHLTVGGDHPKFDRFSYIEKLEYWALVWGSIVMTVTGFALWAANYTLRWMPKWALDVATVIHYYEAILAVSAIVVWHFYWVIFNPKVYPMSRVWWTGRMSEEEMAEEHPKELERLKNR